MVEIVGCSTPHPGKARPMPSATCIEADCGLPARARGRCTTHYQQWRRANLAPPIPRPAFGECPLCGPWERQPSQTLAVCPTCEMTPGEHAYRARILADSVAVYAQEVREFNAQRRRGKA